MKFKVIILSLLSLAAAGTSFGQKFENDDMYFNSKDRAKVREAKSTSIALASSRKSKASDEESNPTDSYSARNVNPEYTSRAHSKTTQADEHDYYVANYRYANQGQYNNFNSSYNNWYSNPWYRSNYYGSSINGWNTPYYGSAYDSYGNPWANPYYRSAYSSGFSFYYGRSWGYGNGSCFSCSPYAYYDPFNPYGYSNYGYSNYGYSNPWGGGMNYAGGGYYGGGYNRPYRVVYIDNDDYRGNYGKRNSRSSQIDRDNGGNRGDGRIVEGRDGRTNSGGRTNPEYYDNTWRNTNRTNTNSNSTYSTPSRTATPSWNNNNSNNSSNNSRSSWESQQRSNSTYTPAPSRSSDAGRSSTPSSGSSSGGGSRSRGRD